MEKDHGDEDKVKKPVKHVSKPLTLRQRFASQDHVFRFFSSLTAAQRTQFEAQLSVCVIFSSHGTHSLTHTRTHSHTRQRASGVFEETLNVLEVKFLEGETI